MTDVPAILRGLRVSPSAEPLALVGLPLTAWASVVESKFADPARGDSVLVTPGEMTLVVPWGRAPVARGLFPGVRVEGPFRLLTLDVALDWHVVGFLAAVTSALAEAGVVVGALASFDRDHLLVPEAQLEAALAAIDRLKETAAVA